MGIAKTLWKVVRRPMTRWWLRNGSWWLLGIVLINVAYCAIVANMATTAHLIPTSVFTLIGASQHFVPLTLFVVAASVCDGFAFQLFDQQAAPRPMEFLWGRYLLALCQVFPIALIAVLASMASSVFFESQGLYSDVYFSNPFWIITTPISLFTSLVWSGIWYVLFVVLGANRPWLKYGVFAAALIAVILNTLLAYSPWMSPDNPFTYSYSLSTLFYFAGLPLWLVFAYVVKSGKQQLAVALQSILAISIMASFGLSLMYENFGGSFLKGITFSMEIIVSPIQSYPQLLSPMINWFATTFDPQDNVLGYLPFLLKPIQNWINPCFLLGVIYLFVFSSYPKGWVGYWRGKMSSSR